MWYSKTGKKEYTFSYRDTLTSIDCNGARRLFGELKADATWTKDTIFDDTLEAVTKNAVLDLLQPPKTVTYEVSWVGDKYQFCLKKGDTDMVIDGCDVRGVSAIISAKHENFPLDLYSLASSDGTRNSSFNNSSDRSDDSTKSDSLHTDRTDFESDSLHTDRTDFDSLHTDRTDSDSLHTDRTAFGSDDSTKSNSSLLSGITNKVRNEMIQSAISKASALLEMKFPQNSNGQSSEEAATLPKIKEKEVAVSPDTSDDEIIDSLQSSVPTETNANKNQEEKEEEEEEKEDESDVETDDGTVSQGTVEIAAGIQYAKTMFNSLSQSDPISDPADDESEEAKMQKKEVSMITSGIQYASKLLESLQSSVPSETSASISPSTTKNQEKEDESDVETDDRTVSQGTVEIAAGIQYAKTMFNSLSQSGPISVPVGVQPHITAGIEIAKELHKTFSGNTIDRAILDGPNGDRLPLPNTVRSPKNTEVAAKNNSNVTPLMNALSKGAKQNLFSSSIDQAQNIFSFALKHWPT